MKYVFFPQVPWDDFAYRHLAELLSTSGEVVVVYPEIYGQMDGSMTFLSGDQVATLPLEECIALVAHPFMPTVVPLRRFQAVVALHTEATPGIRPELWRKYRNLVMASSELIVTNVESVYTELLFQYEPVLFIASAQAAQLSADQGARVQQRLLQALDLVIKRRPIDWIKREQWAQRLQFCQLQSQADESNESLWFLQALYSYLLGEGEQAAQCLKRSFAASILSGGADPLKTRFRFLAAIQALDGLTQQALHTYGITCVTEEERAHFDKLQVLFQRADTLVVLGDLLSKVGDLRTAARYLEQSRDEHAATLLRLVAIQLGDVERALSQYVPGKPNTRQAIIEQAWADTWRGQAYLMQGERRLAMRCFWQAATHIHSFAELFEIAEIDRALQLQSSAVPLSV